MNTSTVNSHDKNIEEQSVAYFDYDPSGNIIGKHYEGFDGIHLKRQTQYDLFSNKITYQQAIEDKHGKHFHHGYRYHYNEDNLLSAMDTPKSSDHTYATQTYAYDENGNRIQTTLYDGHEIYDEYDALQQHVSSTWQRNNLPYKVIAQYSADGHLQSLSDNTQIISYKYTLSGNLRSITYPDNHSLSYDYDEFNRVSVQNDASGRTQSFIYDVGDLGHLSALHVEGDRITYTYGKDENGIKKQLVSSELLLSNGDKRISRYHYGAMRSLSTVTTIDQNESLLFGVDYQHNVRGQLVGQATHFHQDDNDSSGDTVTYKYDSLNRLIVEKHPIDEYCYRYDSNNNIHQEIISEAGNTASTLDYHYNTRGQLQHLRGDFLPSDADVIHDVNGRLIRDYKGSTYTYDDRDHLLRTVLPNAIPSPLSSHFNTVNPS